MRLMVLVLARLNLCMSSVCGEIGVRYFPPRQIQQLFTIMLLGVSLRYNEYLGMIDNIKAV